MTILDDNPINSIIPEAIGRKTLFTIRVLTLVPVLIYVVVALFLSILAIISLLITGYDIISMIKTAEWDTGIIKVIYSLLLTVIIIELFETVTVYLRTKKVPVRAILIAGLTAMIRHVIVFNISEAAAFEIVGPALVMAVLIAGIYLLEDDIQLSHIKV